MIELLILFLILFIIFLFFREILSALILSVTMIVVLFGVYYVVDRVVYYDIEDHIYVPEEFQILADTLEPKNLEYEMELIDIEEDENEDIESEDEVETEE